MPDALPELSKAEVESLPDRLRRKYWAGRIGHGVEGLCTFTLVDAIDECRRWLDMVNALKVGDRVKLHDGRSGVLIETDTDIDRLHLIGRLCTVQVDRLPMPIVLRMNQIAARDADAKALPDRDR